MKPLSLAALGAVTGGLAAASIYLPVDPFPAFEVAGRCIGGIRVLGACSGMTLAVYVLPGLIFGAVIGAALRRAGRLSSRAVAVFASVATAANALAVIATLTAIEPLERLLGGHVGLAGAGLIGGAIGGGLLAVPAAVGPRPLLAGAALGLLLPLFESVPGEIAFYVLWQAGYAAALAARG